jgi:hypothetical protein
MKDSVYAVIMSRGEELGEHTLVACAETHVKAHQFILNNFQDIVDCDNCCIFNSSNNIYSVVMVNGDRVEWYPGNIYFTIVRRDLI